ncbi:MAG: hypothetical protein ABIH83_04900 [Candidatus Micrarchaeota archaeon]
MSKIIRLSNYGIKGLTVLDAVRLANKKKVRILNNKEFDNRLVLTDEWEKEKKIYPAWTGTFIAYEKKDKKLNSTIERTVLKSNQKYIFEVPPDAQNQKNIILAIDHGFDEKGNPIFELKDDGKNILVVVNDLSKIKIIENFPTTLGPYSHESQFGIPVGNSIHQNKKQHNYNSCSNDNLRHLTRSNGAQVGFIARSYFEDVFGSPYYVCTGWDANNHLGVLAEQNNNQKLR